MEKMHEKPFYPFSAIVAQSKLKLSLILNAIDPTIGGVLLTGPKGTGKSLAVRALIEILPQVEVVKDCVFNCKPYDPTNMCEDCRSRSNSHSLPKTSRKMNLVQIPIGATEDRVIGTLDVEKAIQQGIRDLQPGLLAEANQGILYVDEVNLLPDHIVDTILDATSSGWNIVEREGISVTHPSRFILIGTMNPEEGELRPQILDRFGLHVKTQNLDNVEERIKVIQDNETYLRDPIAFHAKYKDQQEEIMGRIEAARKTLPCVRASPSVLASVARMCNDLEVDGYRPDIVMVKTAKAHAALNGRDETNLEDVIAASELTLTHRTRKSGLTPPPSLQEVQEAFLTTSMGKILRTRKDYLKTFVSRAFKKINPGSLYDLLSLFIPLLLLLFFTALFSLTFFPFQGIDVTLLFVFISLAALTITIFLLKPKKATIIRLLDFSKITSEQTAGLTNIIEDSDGPRTVHHTVDLPDKAHLDSGPKIFANISEPRDSPPKSLHDKLEERTQRGRYYLVGKRAKIVASSSRGRYVWCELPKERPWDIAFGPTIRVAAPYQLSRDSRGLAISIESEDLRVKMREYRAPFSIILLVDMSLSMAVSISNLGRAILSLHRSVYRRRDRVGLIVFKGSEAVVLQHPTTNLNLCIQKLWKVGASDFTPMAAGLLQAWKVLKLEKQRNKDTIPMLIVFSDGIVNVPLSQPLSVHEGRELLSRAQADVIDVARLLIRDGVRIIVINTAHRRDELLMEERKTPSLARYYLPTEFLKELARIVGGSYYGLSLQKEAEVIKGTKLEQWFYIE